ncbi:HPr family phosphocarrier protein [Halalkalibacter alkalisediminis]|uniref:HPr family phosphocarrier protein n=1 Tax=Halalkalibacter alkalisediminis TaxID=935616 RepID=A0ABV6NDH8_9BACI|nr:HPr family phosphocarrier protein [Halalkalibacter alkalisediminis]
MSETASKQISIHISEEQTITELSKLVQHFKAEIYLKKIVNGNVIEVNLKSFLGLITLQLKNNDRITVRTIGSDYNEALSKVVEFLT